MPSMWPFSGASAEASSSRLPPPDTTPQPRCAAAEGIPPLIICEGFLSAAQSVVWGNEFRTYLGVGHQQLVDQLPFSPTPTSPTDVPTPTARRRKRRSGLGSHRPVVFAPIGPVSSLHDRACELFYALRGGTVDYGEQHAKQHGHARYGRHYDQPLCPSWGPPRSAAGSTMQGGLPAHFLGHSLGGPTILKLQQLLRQGFFDHALGLPTRAGASPSGEGGGEGEEGWRAEDLILSITSVSSPFRGTPLVYSLGSEPLPYPKVRMFSFGDLLSKFIHIAAYLDLPFFDAHADAWHFSAKRRKALRRSLLPWGVAASEPTSTATDADDPEAGHAFAPTQHNEKQQHAELEEHEAVAAAGVREFLRQLWKSDWAGGRDCAPWDCTFAERDQDRAEDGWGLEQDSSTRRAKTWYRSYAGGMTVPDQPAGCDDVSEKRPGFHRPETYWSLSPLTFTAHLIGHFDYSRLQPCPSFLRATSMERLSPAWWENDGVVPLASQFHPLDCHPDRCRHFSGMPASLPFGTRKKRPQSTDFRLHTPAPLSPASETATLVDVEETPSESKANVSSPTLSDEIDAQNGTLLPLPATQGTPLANRSMLGSAKSAAKIAYFTSLRAINLHDPPLLTPSEEELRSFLPHLTPSDSAARQKVDAHEGEQERELPGLDPELLEPNDNKWYTFQIPNLDHTSLCPFWTGSEVQKQFWTGIGFFLASVDRKAGYTVLETAPAAAHPLH